MLLANPKQQVNVIPILPVGVEARFQSSTLGLTSNRVRIILHITILDLANQTTWRSALRRVQIELLLGSFQRGRANDDRARLVVDNDIVLKL